MASKGGGVDTKPIGGFASAKAQYEKRVSGSQGNSSAPKGKGGAASAASNKKPAAASGGTGGGAAGQSALFAAINKGGAQGNLTQGLNKVTSDMKTKNRKDRSGKVANVSKPKAAAAKKVEEKEQDKPSEIKVAGTQISVSYYKNMTKLLVFGADDTSDNTLDYDNNSISMKNVIEFWNCDTAYFRVAKKCNAIKLYNCKNVQIEIKSVLTTIEITNCKKVGLFVQEKAGSIVMERCEGTRLVLFPAAADADPAPQIITTMCKETELSISYDEPVDVPVPIQFVTTKVDGKWQTTAMQVE